MQGQLRAFDPSELPFAQRATGNLTWQPLGQRSLAVFLLLVARLNRATHVAVACSPRSLTSLDSSARRHLSGPLPLIIALGAQDTAATWDLKVEAGLSRLEGAIGFIADLPARSQAARSSLDALSHSPIRIVRWNELPGKDVATANASGAALSLHVDASGQCAALFDQRELPADGLIRLLDSWATLEKTLLDPAASCRTASLLSAADLQLLDARDRLSPSVAAAQRVHEQFEAQVVKRPLHRACTFDGESLTYAQLNAAANRLARRLQTLSVGRGSLVGVHVPRSLEMLVALLAIQKTGAAYLPLDPTYPPDRLAYMVGDAGVSVVLSRSDVPFSLDVAHDLKLDRLVDELAAFSDANLDVPGDTADLAYVMYTSGSTGKPKGVMVEHRNVTNFFDGIDERLGAEPGVWLAITSISFDISVLELFWTLARGFTVVLHGDALRQKGRARTVVLRSKPMAFGLFYWNVANGDSDHAPDKYRLLLESARFADEHGFSSVWTPERHFESFGGLFPNPSVTSAALATITRNVQLRAGSCVVPLHSPIRIAEEWSVVDNLSNGRVGISVASGWAAPDFAIRPESFADSKNIMFESLDIIRRLWRGESVEFPGPKGKVQVRTLPRPIQKELPIWVTTAGNIETFIQAGKVGAHLLTHLLSQTVEETAVKIAAYRRAWNEAGHSGRGIVSLMLHTFVGPDRAAVESIVRQPLKDYLKSAVALLKAAAWQSPTFKKFSEAQGKSLDDFFLTVSDQDMDQLLEFAFQRYFNNSGLFGTPEDCEEIVQRTAAAGVDEIACLIDFGIDVDQVLSHLPYLDQVRQGAQQETRDYSIASLLKSEGVTHFQCTPTMAGLLASDADAQPGLSALQQMMVGGEALAPDLARTLAAVVNGRVSNMYGPTETTIWSSTAPLDQDAFTPAGTVTIGTPLRNQVVHVLDDFQQRVPPGLPGELVIGGLGVTRGYLHRPELTGEKYLPDPLTGSASGSRMYRTGDLGRWLEDGRLEFLGRRDHQVKIHGYRIELGEIETLLREDPDIFDAVVILREDSPGDKRLVGYVQAAKNASLDTAAVRLRLGATLPDFMVPSVIVALASLPQTPNGKIDRKALPAPSRRDGRVPDSGSVVTVPQGTNLENLVAEIWRRVLGLEEIGLRDNFFDIGGHSLLIIQVLQELREKVPRRIQMTDLFRHTTIEALAQFLAGADASPDVASQRGRSRAEARRAATTRTL
ncbi:MAG: MupA/Atu3671 family FMN-dependent luciferase-like monooxygenase [Steroidobacteraceae bacterium]